MASKGPNYVLHYWPGIPGRGEHIRLAFESVSQPYTEKHSPLNVVMKTTKNINPPHFAPPVLEVTEDGSTSSSFISQTAAILAYLAPILQLDGTSSSSSSSSAAVITRAQVNQMTLTILDLNNEAHDVHHPISVSDYYENQKQEAIKRANDFRKSRLPKFFKFFQLTLTSNAESNDWLIGSHFTTADLVLYQVLDGLHFAFPRLLSAMKKAGQYDAVFALRKKVADINTLKSYLSSDRRQSYSQGIFRHYPELDGEE